MECISQPKELIYIYYLQENLNFESFDLDKLVTQLEVDLAIMKVKYVNQR